MLKERKKERKQERKKERRKERMNERKLVLHVICFNPTQNRKKKKERKIKKIKKERRAVPDPKPYLDLPATWSSR